MKSRWIGLVVFLLLTGTFFSLAPQSVPDLGGNSAWGDDDDKLPFSKNATVTTLITTPRRLFRLTGDNHRNLYTIGFGKPPCAVWQINLHKPSLIPVGFIVPAVGDCGFNGIAFNQNGDLFVVDAGVETTQQLHIHRPGPFTRLNQAPRIRPSPPFSPQAFQEPAHRLR